jgi:hypothetical protein
MNRRTISITRLFTPFFSALLLISLISSCSYNNPPLTNIVSSPSPAATLEDNAVYKADITFQVEIPASTSPTQIYIDILDEVTGLQINPLRYTMLKVDATHFAINIPFQIGSVVKYRYSLEMDSVKPEVNAFGNPIRYRMVYVHAPGVIKDIVSTWSGIAYQGAVGRVQGKVVDFSNNPIPNILVNVGGSSTLTTSDGSFLIEGLVPGVHNLVSYSLNGSYYPFQQEALVAAESMTPAMIQMPPTQLVNITFFVSLPENFLRGIPVRLIGNSFSLGNTYADLMGGMSTIASRAPLLTLLDDGRYSITLRLPVGFDLEYKYTLGDGFWNAEMSEDGSFQLRHLIIPATDMVINDTFAVSAIQDFAPITFRVTVPQNTPAQDLVSIQFNPGQWTEPIPMWPVGNSQWLFVLYTPLNSINNVSYRYCRNDQCGVANALQTNGQDVQGIPFTVSSVSQSFEDTVETWTWLPAENSQPTIIGSEVVPRDSSFMGGVEFINAYDPNWQAYLGNSFQNILEIGSDLIFLSPTWRYISGTPPVMEPDPGKDMLWDDVTQAATWAAIEGLHVGLFPSIENGAENPWASTIDHGSSWWQSWFDRYRTFLIHHADLAAQINASELIIGGSTILPALTGGMLLDGSSSGVPADADSRWKQMIVDIRSHYQGTLIWAVPYDNLATIPSFVSDVDKIYVLISAPLANDPNPTINEMSTEFGRILDEVIYPLQQNTGKPVLIGVQYPSIDGAYLGCYKLGETCTPFDDMYESQLDYSLNPVNAQTQLDIYSAIFLAINNRPWISGIISRGYYPPVGLIDGSFSIHNKPASAVIWYWLPRMKSQN